MNIRPLRFLVLLYFALLAVAVAVAEESLVQGVDSIGITVSDLDRAVKFYTEVLSFEPDGETEIDGEAYEHLYGVFGLRLRVARLRLGDEAVELMQFLAPQGRPIPVDSRSNDRWFQHAAIITSNMDRAYRRLREHGVSHASSGPQKLPDWNPNAGGISAFYFRDPDGNHLEILQFPSDKGARKWHAQSGKLFLGIDHTAIVVANTDESVRFYRDLYGMEIAGTSENYGPEQERLNNVFGARLRITALRASSGPGIELLEYIAPAGGRPFPEDTRANDLWHWQVNMTSPDIEAAWKRLRMAQAAFISPGPVDIGPGPLGYRQGLLLRDPDGHASLLQMR